MSDKNWEDIDNFDDEINNDMSGNDRKQKGKVRKRKWREIEDIKEQRRLRRHIEEFEQYSY